MALGGAVGVGVTAVVVGLLKHLGVKGGRKSSRPPPSSTGRVELQSTPPPGWDVLREQVRELRDWSQEQTREAVHAANARHSIGQIAEALQALVIALDRDRADTQRDRDRSAADRDQSAVERREIIEHLKELAHVVEALSESVASLEEEET